MPSSTHPPQLRITPYGLFGRAPMSRVHPVFTIGMLLFGLAAIAFPLGTTIGQGQSIMALGTIPFVLLGLAIILGAVWLMIGSRAVMVKRGRLKPWYGIGPFGFAIPLPMNEFVRLRLEVTKASENSGGVHDLPYDLVAEFKPKDRGKDSITLVESAEPAWLKQWGEEIAEALGTELSVARSVAQALDPPKDDRTRPIPGVRYPDPPADSPFSLDVREGHVTITGVLDKHGKKRTTTFLFMGAFFMAMATGVGWLFYSSGSMSNVFALFGLGSMLALFFFIGAALFVYGALARTDRWVLDVAHDGLLITARQAGRSVSRTIDGANVREVRVAHSGESTGGAGVRRRGHTPDTGTPVMQLQIVPRSGPWARLMTGCSDESLAWTAGVLRASLGLDEEGGEEAAPG